MNESPRTTGSRGQAGTASRRQASLCAFWIRETLFGIDVALAGEVIPVASLTPVPMSPDGVRGLVNLRGRPVALVDLGEILAVPSMRLTRDPAMALIIEHGELSFAFGVDAVEAVVSRDRGSVTEPGPDEAACVESFFVAEDGSGRVITVLDRDVLLLRLEAIRFARDEREDGD